MATVTSTLIASNVMPGVGASNAPGWAGGSSGYHMADIYFVSISIDAADKPLFNRPQFPAVLPVPPSNSLGGQSPSLSGSRTVNGFIDFQLSATPSVSTAYSTTDPDALVYDPYPGVDICYFNIQTPYATGRHIGSVSVIDGTTTNFIGVNCLKLKYYICFINIVSGSSITAPNNSTIAISSSALENIYEMPVNGIFVNLSQVSSCDFVFNSAISPAYKPVSGNYEYNKNTQPMLSRRQTFSSKSFKQGPDWRYLTASGGVVVDQTFKAPVGLSFTGPSSGQWVPSLTTIKVYSFAFSLTGTGTIRAYFTNCLGKVLPAVVVSGTWYPVIAGEEFFYGSIAVPDKIVMATFTIEIAGVEYSGAQDYRYPLPVNYAACLKGDWLPGINFSASITASDHP